MELKTIEDVCNAFPDEDSVRKYLKELRWGQWAACPYCGNTKCYIDGKRFRCAAKVCYKKFSVTSHTLMESTLVPLDKWMQIVFIYVRSRGKCMSYDFEKETKIHFRTALIIKDKLDYVWGKVLKEGSTTLEIINNVFECLFNCYDVYDNFKNKKYIGSAWHEKFIGITDISNPHHYNTLIFYIKTYLRYLPYIWIDFASAEDILAETFIRLKDNDIKDYDSDFLLKYINRTITKMWTKFLNEHPKFNQHIYKKNKDNRRRYRKELTDYAVVEEIMKSPISKWKTRSEIKQDKELIIKWRERIKSKRIKTAVVPDWKSHFD